MLLNIFSVAIGGYPKVESTLRAQGADLAYQIISRKEARAAGLLNYKTGVPCKKGHFRRSVSTGKCVSCRTAKKRVWALANPEKRIANKQREKAARVEKFSGQATYVPVEPCQMGHFERYVKSRGCVQCAKLASAQRYQDNPEAASQYWKMRRQVDGEALNARGRELRLSRLTIVRAQEAAWRKANPDQQRSKEKRRRARERGAAGSHTAAEVKALFFRQKGKCAYCRTSIKDYYEEDHIVALANGGSDYISNIQLTCGPCNWSKGARHPIEFAQSVGLLL